MSSPIYLDYAASTPTDPVVADAMHQHLCLGGNFANPASRGHVYGWQADEAVESARAAVARILNANPREIVWTSGATESDNLAIKGLMSRGLRTGRKHIVTSAIEHKAILDTCAWMEDQGFSVSYLQASATGAITPAQVQAALRDDTLLVTVMQVNNELGSISDIAGIAKLCRERGVISHTDAAQSFGKIPVDVQALGVDLLSLSAHKIYGPKGIGLMYVRNGSRWMPWLTGGSQERRRRGGTTNVPGVIGFAKALEIATRSMEQQLKTYQELNQHLLSELKAHLHACEWEMNGKPGVHHITNFCFQR